MSWNEAAATQTHPLIAVPNHDELAEQLFVRDLKLYVMQTLEPTQRQIANRILAATDTRASNSPVSDLREQMTELESFKDWIGIKREAQRQLWRTVGDSVERQADRLEQLAAIEEPLGSVTLDPDFALPAYVAEGDIHLMPGGNGMSFLVRAREEYPHMQRILVTGYMKPELLLRSVNEAALFRYLLKPVSFSELIKVVQDAAKACDASAAASV